MKFDKIKQDSDCNCFTKAIIDYENEFVRKLRKEKIDEKDFLTHWERNIRPESLECDNICSSKGVSVNLFKSDFEKLIIEKYKTTFNINPKKGAYILKFKFLENAGKVKYSPEENDTTHYNFFKADDFSIEMIKIIDTIKFI